MLDISAVKTLACGLGNAACVHLATTQNTAKIVSYIGLDFEDLTFFSFSFSEK